ncbi:MAG: alanine racemase [Pseudohongiellaceae bacterium]
MPDIPPRATAVVDLTALQHNYARVSALCPEAGIVPAIKANAYGHGAEPVARALSNAKVKPAAFGVATLDEALQLDSFKLDIPIVLLGGCIDGEELAVCLNAGIEPVIHSAHQMKALEKMLDENFFTGHHRLWLKMNTGMNRLGLSAEMMSASFARLHTHPDIEVVLMSHLACADEGPDNESVQHQLKTFAAMHKQLGKEQNTTVNSSIAASSAIMGLPGTAYQFVRPGIMLYGGTPLVGRTADELDLKPVMTLRSRLVAVNKVRAGGAIGYGATYTCSEDTRVGVVSIGYADGYMRSATNGGSVLVKSDGQYQLSKLLGRVSMDLIVVNLNAMPKAEVGDEVVLWGAGLSIDEVAEQAGTISYELLCGLSRRVKFEYLGQT